MGLASPMPPLPRQPEATFTPTAAGLRAPAVQLPPSQVDFQALLSNALSSLLAAGLQQASLQPPQAQSAQPMHHSSGQHCSRSPTKVESASSDDSERGKEAPENIKFSDDKGMISYAPAFSGLFQPSLFKSLLHKARQMTNIGVPEVLPTEPSSSLGPHDALFSSFKPGKDFIPCPQLFSDVLQSPWSQPGSLTGPSSQDKRLYCAVG